MVTFTRIHKKIQPTRLTFRHLYLMYKNLYDSGKIVKNGSAYQRMMKFKSKFLNNPQRINK